MNAVAPGAVCPSCGSTRFAPETEFVWAHCDYCDYCNNPEWIAVPLAVAPAQATRRQGCYLLHFERPIGTQRQQAQHYTGWAQDIIERVSLHRRGKSGAKLMDEVYRRNISFQLVRIWPGADHAFERFLKIRFRSARELCPLCQAEKHERKMAQQRARRKLKKEANLER